MMSCWFNVSSSRLSNRTLYWFTRLVYTEPVGQTCVPLLLMLTSLNLTPACRWHFLAITSGCSLHSINRSTPTHFSSTVSLDTIIGFFSNLNGVGVPGLFGITVFGFALGSFPKLLITASANWVVFTEGAALSPKSPVWTPLSKVYSNA